MKFATANPRTQAGRLSVGGEEGGDERVIRLRPLGYGGTCLRTTTAWQAGCPETEGRANRRK